MNEILLFLLLGLGTGATIAAIAVGIVVTYRGSGFINLAAGAIAMLAGFSFWALRTGELGFTVSHAARRSRCPTLFVVLVTVRHRARGLPAAPHRRAAREARRVARRPPHGAGGDAPRIRHLAASPADDHPDPGHPHARCGRAAVRLRPQRHGGGDDARALGALPLDALRARDAGGVGERRRRPPRGPVAERAVARELDARQPRARHPRDPRRLGGGARHDHACRSSSCRLSPRPSSPGSPRSRSRAPAVSRSGWPSR